MPQVLVIDDEPSNLKLLETFLTPDGYELVSVNSGEAALSAVSEGLPDLILLDLMMPGMDGFSVLERLKSDAWTRLVPVVVVTAAADREHRLRAVELGAEDLLSKPVDRAELRACVRNLVRMRRHVEEAEQLDELLRTLAHTIEARDLSIRDHCKRLEKLVLHLGAEFALSEDHLHSLKHAAHLHDIGKISIPDAILFKSGPLNEVEWAVVRAHPAVGEEILRPLRTMDPVRPLVRHHHERLDGSGYPDGLSGEDISLPVRILSVADVFDTLVSHRPYRRALSVPDALRLLDEEAARGFWDVDVVAAVKRLALSGEGGFRV